MNTLVDQLLASNPKLESACVGNDDNMNQLWSACETWVLGLVYDKIIGACKQMFGRSDKCLDANLARLDKVDPIVLGVRSEFKEFVLGEALSQFRMINRGRTPLEKAICLRKSINCIIEGIQTVISSCSGTEASRVCPNTFQRRDYAHGCEISKFAGFLPFYRHPCLQQIM